MDHLGSAVPAYGRDYKSGVEVYAAWIEGKDFNIGGTYINRTDAEATSNAGSVNIRYKKLTQVAVIAWDGKGRVTLNGKVPKGLTIVNAGSTFDKIVKEGAS